MNIFSKIEAQRFVQEGFIVKHHFFDASEVEVKKERSGMSAPMRMAIRLITRKTFS
jgi:hypothetical protein